MSAAFAQAPRPPAIRVLICDDSAVVRGAYARLLEAEADVEIVARAGDGAAALSAVRTIDVDVVLLDIEMPVMDGLTALPRLLQARPALRVIMCSTRTAQGADVAMRALRLGAYDYLAKPEAHDIGAARFRDELLAKLRGAVHRRLAARAPSPTRPAGRTPDLVAIGSSTGGPQALFTLLAGWSAPLPVPVVITQHMPATFLPMLAEHLSRIGAQRCALAEHGRALVPGQIAIAPGDRHMHVTRRGAELAVRLSDDPPENFSRPAVDPMLRSAADACAGRVLTVMLTGMGQDGLLGTRAVIAAGGTALAQDEASSVVWGMPGAIAREGLCHSVVPLGELAARVSMLLRRTA